MRFFARILARFRARRASRSGGYGPEVLFAGWVQLPESFRVLARREPGAARRTSSA